MQKQILLIAIVAVSLFVVGCGKNPKITGKVYYVDDNSPVVQGTVIFLSDNYTGRAQIEKDGSYSVHSESTGYGLPPGTYQVYLDGTEKAIMDGGGLRLEQLVDKKYTSASSSGLTLTVNKSQKYDIPVERPSQSQ